MPGGDRTGPAGMGPMTGRAAGYCAGYGMPGYLNPIFGRGYGGWGRGYGGWGRGYGGWGGGWGHRNWYYATGLPGWARAGWGYPIWQTAPATGYAPTYPSYGAPPYAPTYPPYGAPLSREQELDTLKGQAEYFEDSLDGIKKRIEELEKKEEK